MARPPGDFDASRYFRGDVDLGFYNVGTGAMRALAKAVYTAHHGQWALDDAVAFAEALIRDRHMEVKGLAIELLARYQRSFTPRLLPTWKRWLAAGHAANWATTDAVSSYLIGPLLSAHPKLARQMHDWSRHRSLWVRRASAVSLLHPMRRGLSLDLVYGVARTLHADREDLIQKAVGWLLREAGKLDPVRLERYLKDNGPTIPRTTVRYAIERMPEVKRRRLLLVTRAVN